MSFGKGLEHSAVGVSIKGRDGCFMFSAIQTMECDDFLCTLRELEFHSMVLKLQSSKRLPVASEHGNITVFGLFCTSESEV